MSIDPATDQIRVVNNLTSDGAGGLTNNVRLDPATGALVQVDTDLNFSGLPDGGTNAPAVALGHLRAAALPATTYGIVSGLDRLVRSAA